MINEILCAFFIAGLAACASVPPVHRETDLNASVRRIQVHEAEIERCRCAAGVCDVAQKICDEATQLSDADLRARCHRARHACDAQSARHDQECGCE